MRSRPLNSEELEHLLRYSEAFNTDTRTDVQFKQSHQPVFIHVLDVYLSALLVISETDTLMLTNQGTTAKVTNIRYNLGYPMPSQERENIWLLVNGSVLTQQRRRGKPPVFTHLFSEPKHGLIVEQLLFSDPRELNASL